MKNCKTEPKGYDISKHFQNCANLKALDRAVANQSTLRKTLLSAPGNVVKKSEEFLSTLLLLTSDKEKEHTKYLFPGVKYPCLFGKKANRMVFEKKSSFGQREALLKSFSDNVFKMFPKM